MDTMSSVAVNVTGPLVAGTGSDDSPSGYDISGLVISIVGSITLLQAIYTGLQRIFPEKRLKLLDDTLEETIRMYAMALEDGIFEDASKLKSIEHSLLNLRRDSDTLRAKVHVATTFKKQFHAWWNGLSKHLNSVRREVQTIRAELSLETEKERSKLERENRLPRFQLLPANAYAAYDAHRSTASNTLGMGPPISAVNPRFGTTTGIMGLHKPTNSLTTRSHTYPPVSHHLAAPPPAFVPSSSPSSGNSAPSKIDPRKRLHDLTDQLSRAARNYDPVDDGIIHTPDHVACCNATPGTSEIERTVNVLNDLTKRLSFIAASELARPVGERSASKSKPQVNAAQISLLIDALSSAQAVASQQHPTTSDADVPSTATIEEVKDVVPIENQAQAPSTPSAASNAKNH